LPAMGHPDSDLADAAEAVVALFVTEWAARGVPLGKALGAISAATVEVLRRNSLQAADAPLADKVRAVVESGGLPAPLPEEDILRGTDLDIPGGLV
jgi:hypothetical protein